MIQKNKEVLSELEKRGDRKAARKHRRMMRRVLAGKPIHPNSTWYRNTVKRGDVEFLPKQIKLKAVKPKPKKVEVEEEVTASDVMQRITERAA